LPQTSAPLSIELALLGYVRSHAMHGYEIYQKLLNPGGLGDVWRIKQPLLYAYLKRLEAEGLLRATVELQPDRPPRRLLAVTPAGEEAFQQWLVRPVAHGRELRLEFLAKLYFARCEDDAVALSLLDAQLQQIDEWIERLCTHRRTLPAEAVYERLVTDYRWGQVRAALDWLTAVHTELLQSSSAERQCHG